MYKIGDKVEYLNNVWEVCGWEIDSVEIYNEKMGVNIYVPIDDVIPYHTAHEKLIKMGWEDKGYVSDTRRYEAYNMWVTFDITNKTYTINKLVGIAIICPNIDLTLSRILTQYLEEL